MQPQLGTLLLLLLPCWQNIGNHRGKRKGKEKEQVGTAVVTTALGIMGRAGEPGEEG